LANSLPPLSSTGAWSETLVKNNKRESELPGRFAYEGIDRVIHERARLGLLTSLAAHPAGLVFNDLKELCSLTDGNLSRHLQILQKAGLVEIWKGQHQNRPQTLCRITPAGHKRFLEYIAVLEQLVSDALDTADSKPALNRRPSLV
jgi:DNA-binding MarR family transcriptional regulator